jgi:hypothetical protein
MEQLPGVKVITSSAGWTTVRPTSITGFSCVGIIIGLSIVETGRSDSGQIGCQSSSRPPGWTPNANPAETTDIEPDHEGDASLDFYCAN